MAAGRSGGEVGRKAPGAAEGGTETVHPCERAREASAVVIDGQLCLPPEPFIKIQRG